MNRTTVVFLALAILLAHTLAIHQTAEGGFAAPYDRAHVAYRLGRQVVHEGNASWETETAGALSFASPTWIGVGAVAEWLRAPPTRFAQGLGILLALATVIVLGQFSAERLAGLIAPVLFAASGTIAAAAASGTEAPLAMALATTGYLAFERRWRVTLAIVLVGLVWTRPEGLALVLGICLLAWLDPPGADSTESSPATRTSDRSPRLAPALGLALLIIVASLFSRGSGEAAWSAPFLENLSHPGPGQWAQGWEYLRGFFIASAIAPLLLLPVLLMLLRRLRPAGRRPLILFLFWTALVGFSGGDGLPFWNALAPALPLALLSVQDAITGWIDENPRQAPMGWAILVITVLTSFLVSMTPEDLEPLGLRAGITRWMQPSAALARDFPQPMGRAGLTEELRDTEALRSVGIFLRENVEPEARIGTFWPGAVGYLSRRRVIDLLGRTQPAPGNRSQHSWAGAARVDLVKTLEFEFDYLLPSARIGAPGSLRGLLRSWLVHFDIQGDSAERLRELQSSLLDYEVVSVPVPITSREPSKPSPTPFLLLRRRSPERGAQLALRMEGDQLLVEARHLGHRQIVDLTVTLSDPRGEVWCLAPTGEWVIGSDLAARTNLLLYATGSLPMRLLAGNLPDDIESGVLGARLHTPGIEPSSRFAEAARSPDLRF